MLFQQANVGMTQINLVEKDPGRTSLVIMNNHATAIVYIHELSGVSVAKGFPIQPGASISWVIPEDDPTGAIWIISDTATTDVRYYEGFGNK